VNNPYSQQDEYEDEEFYDEEDEEFYDDDIDEEFEDRKKTADELYEEFQKRERRHNGDDAIEFGLNWTFGLIVVIALALVVTAVVVAVVVS